jgi:hypothetical protein
VQESEGSPMVWSFASIVSSNKEELRPERLWAEVAFGSRPRCWFAAGLGKRKASEGAPERGKMFRRRRRGAGSPTLPELSRDAHRCIRFRWGISSCCRRFGRGRREAREEIERAFIEEGDVERGLGFGAGWRDRTAAGAAVFMEESQPEVDDDMWGQGVREREKDRRTALGEFPGGPWADSWPGPDSVPRPLTLFFV